MSQRIGKEDKRMRYKAILFDMDGTVLDTIEDLHDSVNYSLEKFGMPSVALAEVKASLGNGSLYLIEHVVPKGTSPELTKEIHEFYKKWYNYHCVNKTRPYEGIPELMEKLKAMGCGVAIVSNKPNTAVTELNERFFPDIYAIGETAEIRRKPWPDMPLAAAKHLGVDGKDCLYVGDTEVDIKTAQSSGMDCASVSWGFRDEQQLIASGAKSIYRTVSELSDMLLK